jgi:ABC-2 type transport system permease protein
MNWDQLKTILWLRWRLMSNQWRRTGGLGAVIAVFVGVSALGLAAVSFIGGLLGAVFGLAKEPPLVIMLVWLLATLVFLFFWMIGLLAELQRAESIDLQKLMHLPVALGQMFAINYLVSHFSLSIVIFVPAVFGLGVGLAVARGPEMILMIPLALSMVLMVTAWTYCLRGWLATMMSNPRRRRTVIMCITMSFVLLAQGPNLYFNVFQNHAFNPSTSSASRQGRQAQRSARDAATKQMFANLDAAQGFVPPLWVSVGARELAGGNPLPAIFGTLGCAGLAFLGLRRAYRSTVRFYLGETGGKAAASALPSAAPKKIPAARPKNQLDFLERTIPFAPEQSAALALATLRSLLRAPEVKMAWATSFIVTIIVGATFFFRAALNVPDVAKPFIATASVILPVFFLAQFFGNQFGFDRDGFRALMLSPADRRLILLGKNLAALPIVVVYGGLLIALTTVRLHLPPLTVLATLLQFAAVMMMAGVAGNLLSILVPYRIQPGSMKPTKMPGLAMIVLMFSQMLFPMAMLPVLAGPLLELLWHRLQWPDFVPVNLIASALVFGVMALVYWQTLAPLGRLLQRREPKILGVITVEVE